MNANYPKLLMAIIVAVMLTSESACACEMDDRIESAFVTTQVRLAPLSRHSTSVFKTKVAKINGKVALSGKETREVGKDLVTKVAKDVKGVMKVINNMTIEDSLRKI